MATFDEEVFRATQEDTADGEDVVAAPIWARLLSVDIDKKCHLECSGEAGLLVGRHVECSLRLDNVRISNKHAIIGPPASNGDICITDTSTNGTFVNNVKLDKNAPRLLRDGDMVAFVGGEPSTTRPTHFTFALGGAPPTPTTDTQPTPTSLWNSLSVSRAAASSAGGIESPTKRPRLEAPDSTALVDALIFVCAPANAPLRNAMPEAEGLARVFREAKLTAETQDGGDAVVLLQLLRQRRPRVLIFIGHADAPHGTTQSRTLALTDKVGESVLLRPNTLVEVIGNSAAQERLELVFLNGWYVP